MDYREIVGIVAGIFVLVSFLQKGEKRIRMINIIGAGCFIVYGLLINSLSVWVLNCILLIVQFVNLLKLWKKDEKKGE